MDFFFKTIIGFILLAICPEGIFAQNSYYVSPSGDDSNTGSITQTWKHIPYAISRLQPGDTLNIMEGTYPGKIDVSVSGEEKAHILIRNYDKEEVTITGSLLSADEYLMQISGKKYIEIQGLNFADYQAPDARGLSILNSSYIKIEGCSFINIDYSPQAAGETPTEDQNAQPIIILGKDSGNSSKEISIVNCRISQCETGWSEALSINGNVDGFEILNNEIFDNTNIGIVAIGFEGECPDPSKDQARNGKIIHNKVYNNLSAYDVAAGIYIDGGKNIIVENNISYANDYGIEVGCENNGGIQGNPSAENILVRNNLIFKNNKAGLVLGGYNYPITGKVENCIIRNNSLFDNDKSNAYNGEIYLTYIESSEISNNIFYSTNLNKVLMISEVNNEGITMDYNLYYVSTGTMDDLVIEIDGTEYNDLTTYRQQTSQDAHSFFASPGFINQNASPPDLHLAADSPCIDAGDPSIVPDADEKDIDGEARIINNTIDIGADEFDPLSGTGIPEKTETVLFPNPFQTKIYWKADNIWTEFEIYDLNAQRVLKGEIKTNAIEFSSLSPGIYLLVLKDKKGQFFPFKIIKK